MTRCGLCIRQVYQIWGYLTNSRVRGILCLVTEESTSQEFSTVRLKRISKRKIKAAAAWFGTTESSILEAALAKYIEDTCPEIVEAFTPKRYSGEDIETPSSWRPNAANES